MQVEKRVLSKNDEKIFKTNSLRPTFAVLVIKKCHVSSKTHTHIVSFMRAICTLAYLAFSGS